MTNIRKYLFADVNTVGSRHITVCHFNIEQKQAEQSHSVDPTMSHLKTSHTSPLQVSHGVSVLGRLEKTGRKYGESDGTLCNDISQTIWFDT